MKNIEELQKRLDKIMNILINEETLLALEEDF